MNKILKKTYFSEKVVQMVVEAPLIAKSRKPGNFVIVRVGEKGERMPLTISDADPVKGTITLVIQKMGVSSTKLCNLEEGEYITDLVGPLGKATHKWEPCWLVEVVSVWLLCCRLYGPLRLPVTG
jgi:NAD(P)H-flavin reductase